MRVAAAKAIDKFQRSGELTSQALQFCAGFLSGGALLRDVPLGHCHVFSVAYAPSGEHVATVGSPVKV